MVHTTEFALRQFVFTCFLKNFHLRTDRGIIIICNSHFYKPTPVHDITALEEAEAVSGRDNAKYYRKI